MAYPQNSDDFNLDLETLLADLKRLEGLKDEVSSATGDLRATLKQIQEDRGIHKTALAMIRQLNDMPDSKLADVLRTFTPMFEMMQGAWNGRIQDMLDKMDDEKSNMESDLG